MTILQRSAMRRCVHAWKRQGVANDAWVPQAAPVAPGVGVIVRDKGISAPCYPYTSYSEPGALSLYSARLRYPTHLRQLTDPVLIDFFYEHAVRAWFSDGPSYSYWYLALFGLSFSFWILARASLFDPDIMWRRQERRKQFPDRVRQWSYSLPFFNHRLRNSVCKYRWALIDNEPDWIDSHVAGYRPTRKASYRRPPSHMFACHRYHIQDPLFTTLSHENFGRIYRKEGYSLK